MFHWFRKTPEDLQQFIKYLKKSRLLDESEVAEQLKRFRRTSQAKDSLNAFASFLIEAEVITRWQCNLIRDKKYKGFFIDDYLMLYHHDTDESRSYYAARNLRTNENVILAVQPYDKDKPGVHYDVLPFEEKT